MSIPPNSFKTNVNRAKTKRWVEAKSYSYDGDDWGDADDYDEYDGYDDDPAPVQPTAGSNQQARSIAQVDQDQYDRRPVAIQSSGGHGVQTSDRYVTSNTAPRRGSGGQHMMMGQPQLFGRDRSTSFARDDEERSFYVGEPCFGSSGPKMTPRQHATPNTIQESQSPYTQTGQVQNRPSMDSQTRHVDQHAASTNWKGTSHSDQYTQPVTDSRTRSLASNNSALDFHNRRDFSPSAMPPPLHTRGSPSPHGSLDAGSSNRFPPRQSSVRKPAVPLSQQIANAPPMPSDAGSDIVMEDSVQRERTISDAEKPLPFVRPADIYKRMQEERERGRKSQDTSRPSMDAVMDKPIDQYVTSVKPKPERPILDRPGLEQHRNPSFEAGDDTSSSQTPNSQLERLTERHSGREFNSLPANSLSPLGPQQSTYTNPMHKDLAEPELERYTASDDLKNALHPLLPPVQRISGFGDSLFGSDPKRPADGKVTSARNEGPLVNHPIEASSVQGDGKGNLQHQPSAGFRSVVHQAFDRSDDQVPPTPSSTIARSSSERTNDISPVISRGPSAATSDTKVVQAEIREASTPAIAEEPQEISSRPASLGNLGTKQVARKPSPSESPRQDSIGSKPASFIPGHRRDISTPSPDNSPARTPALEVNRQILKPQEAELANTTPTAPNFRTSQVPQPRQPASREESHVATDLTTREANLASEKKHDDLVPSTAMSTSAIDAQNSFSNSRRTNSRKLSKSPSIDSSSSRPNSPTKSRVRGLAEKFESAGSSRRGSQQSLPKSSLSRKSSQQLVNIPSSGPLADRVDSFRPRLPGAWESYASHAPSVASPVSIVPSKDALSDRKKETYRLEKADLNSTPAEIRQIQVDDIEFTPTTEKRKSAEPMPEGHSTDAFAAVAAAGSALAGALAAAVGMETHDESTTPTAEDNGHGPRSSQGSQDFSNTRGRSASIKDMAYHPEASRPTVTYLPDDTDTSVAATPSPNETPFVEKREFEPSGYFPSIAPLQKVLRGGMNQSGNLTLFPRPPMLPSLSTDTTTTPLYESDRLRRDIVRELSPIPPSGPLAQRSAERGGTAMEESSLSGRSSMKATGHESLVIPREYESYWNGSDSGGNPSNRNSNIGAGTQAEAAAEPQKDAHEPLSVYDPMTAADEVYVKRDGPILPTRFSWEESQESFELLQQTISHHPSNTVINSQEPHGQTGMLDRHELLRGAESNGAEPHLTIADTMLEDYSLSPSNLPLSERRPSLSASSHISSTENAISSVRSEHPDHRSKASSKGAGVSGKDDGPEIINTSFMGPQYGATHERVPSGSGQDLEHYNRLSNIMQESEIDQRDATDRRLSSPDRNLPSLPPAPISQPKMRPFREILALKTSSERIQAYNNTREQFANLSTGLAHWITVTANELPEHDHLLSDPIRPGISTAPYKASTTRSKLSILRTSGAGMQTGQQPMASETTSYHGPSSSPAQGSSPSAGLGNRITSQHVQAKGKDLLHTAGVFGGKANVAAKGLFSKGRSKLRGVGADKSPLGLPSSEASSRGMQSPQAQLNTEIPEMQAPLESQAVPASQEDKAVNGQRRSNAPLPRPGPNLVSAPSHKPSSYEPAQPRQLDDGTYNVDAIDSTSEGHLQALETSNEAGGRVFHLNTPRAPSTAERRSSQHQDVLSSLSQSRQDATAKDEFPLDASERGPYSGGCSDIMQGGSPPNITRDGRPSVNEMTTAPAGKDWAQSTETSSLSSREPAAIMSAQLAGKTLSDTPDAHAAPVRKSGESEGTYYTADTSVGKSHRTQPGTQKPETSTISQEVDPWRPSRLGMASGQAEEDLEEDATSNGVAGDPGTRPFSFIDTSLYQPSQSVPDLERRSSNVDGSVQGYSNQSPLPIQLQRSPVIDKENGTAPVYYGPEHDFGSQEEQALPARTRSFSRPFQNSPRLSEDPNIRHHPAFRQETPRPNEMDQVALVSGPTWRGEAGPPRRKGTEYRPDIELTPVGETPSKRRSWRGSRASGIFKGPSSFPQEDGLPTTMTPAERFPPVAGDATKKQSRRASLFRSLTGRSGSGPDRDMDSRKPSLNEHLRDPKDRFNQSRRNSQKKASLGTVGQDPSKKKRFSSMGSLFARSGHSRGRSETPAPQSAHSRPLSQQQHGTISESLIAQSTHPHLPTQLQDSAYYQNDADQYTSSSPVRDHGRTPHPPRTSSQLGEQSQPPSGGYYAPHRRGISPSQGFISPDHLSQPYDPYAPRPSATFPIAYPSYSEPKPSMWARRRSRSRSRSTDRRSRELYPENTSWTPEQGYLDHHISHSRSPSRQTLIRTPLPDTLPIPGNPNVYYEYPQPPLSQSVATQQNRRDASPAPPPPPPKDEWRRSAQRNSSRNVSGFPAKAQSTPSAKTHNRQSLPPLQTSVSPTTAKAKQRNSVQLQSPAERKARQMEIEIGSQRASLWARKAGNDGLERGGADDVFRVGIRAGSGGGMENGGRRAMREDDEVVMSATSFPGQEWRPEGAWVGE